MGKQVADYYQNIAVDMCSGKDKYYEVKNNLIAHYKEIDKRHLIQDALIKLKNEYSRFLPKYPKNLCFLTGEYKDKYLYDMNICQEFASLNRKIIAKIIINKILNKDIDEFNYFQTIHNYINFSDNIVRKHIRNRQRKS